MRIDAFIKSDPMGDVYSFLGAQGQGNLRSSASMFIEAFDAAVRAEIHIGRCGNKEELVAREDFGALVSSWFPLSEKRCAEAPAPEKDDQQLGTLVINLQLLFNGTHRVADGFLEGCAAQSIIYFQAEHVTSAGGQWMANCSHLSSVHFAGRSALTTVGDGWLRECESLTSLSFEGLTALTTVGSFWLYRCRSLPSVDFDGLTALTTVGSFWLSECTSLTSVSFDADASHTLFCRA